MKNGYPSNLTKYATVSGAKQYSQKRPGELLQLEKEFEEKYGKSPYSVINNINSRCKSIRPGTINRQNNNFNPNESLLASISNNESTSIENGYKKLHPCYVDFKYEKLKQQLVGQNKMRLDTESTQELELDLGEDRYCRPQDIT